MSAEQRSSAPAGDSRALYVLLTVVFINMAGFGVVIPLLPFYAKAFGAAEWQVFVMFSAFSLGNFIFDQSSPRGSGALLELRVFGQGTVAARLVPIPNLFDLTRAPS